MKATTARQKQATEQLAAILKEGDTLFTVIRSKGRTGNRQVQVLRAANRNEISDISLLVAIALDCSYDVATGLVKVKGTGFDAAHSVVADLAYALFGNERLLYHDRL